MPPASRLTSYEDPEVLRLRAEVAAAEDAEAEDDYRLLHDYRQQPDQLQPLTADEQQELKKLFRLKQATGPLRRT